MVRLFGVEVGHKKATRARGPSMTGTQRLDLEKARALTWVKKHHPELYTQIVQGLFGIRPEKETDIDKLLSLQVKIRQLQDADSGQWTEMLKMAPAVMGALFGGVAQQPRTVEQPANPPALPQAPQVPALPEGRKRRSAPRPNRISPKRRAGMEAKQQQEPASMTVSQLVMQGINGKRYEDAAAWLLASQEPLIQRVVPQLLRVPDFALMHEIAKLKTLDGWGELAGWLEQNEEWTRAVVRSMKEQSKQTA